MDLIDHFSCYTHLPVKLADVASHIVETGAVDKIYRYAVDVDPAILRGIFRSYHHKPPYAPGGQTVAEVIYSKHLGPFDSRFVQCKEMLHAFDSESHMASRMEQVEQLAEDIIVPLDVLMRLRGLPSKQVLSDNGKVFTALAILLPRDFLDEVRPIYQAGRVTVAQIAQLAQVPTPYVRLALRDDWQELADAL